jgi:hypothetical protein
MTVRVAIAIAFVIAFAMIIGACSSGAVLLSKPAAVPAGINFSGNWAASGSTGSSQPSARELSVHVFLEMGKTLKVTQTDSGLFFSFDRSVVEEYRFGENREINVGEISAARASGWEGNSYVIETLDDDGAKLIETYRLEKEASVMLRTIVLLYRNEREIELEQVFNRI